MSGHREGHGGSVDVAVLVVSTTRTVGDDRSGVVLGERLTAAGHRAISRTVVDDDVELIRRAVKKAVEDGVPAIVLTGGTGFGPRDVTPEALAPLFTRRIEGFGELFRVLSFEEIGAAAMLSRAVAGVIGRTAVFAVPGSPAACRLAIDKLVAPELAHLVGLLKEAPATAPARAGRLAALDEPTADLEVVDEAPSSVPVAGVGPRGSVEVRHREDEAQRPAAEEGGWQKRIRELGGTLRLDERTPFPEEIERLAPVVDVLVGAGDVGVLEAADGRRWSIWGFPDLRRPSSKVLLLGPGWPLCELVALHRASTPLGTFGTGTTLHGGTGLCVSRDADAAEITRKLLEREAPGGPAQLFAVSGDAVYLDRGGKVTRWDGTKEQTMGSTKQALASLVLEWSTR